MSRYVAAPAVFTSLLITEKSPTHPAAITSWKQETSIMRVHFSTRNIDSLHFAVWRWRNGSFPQRTSEHGYLLAIDHSPCSWNLKEILFRGHVKELFLSCLIVSADEVVQLLLSLLPVNFCQLWLRCDVWLVRGAFGRLRDSRSFASSNKFHRFCLNYGNFSTIIDYAG